MALGTGGAGQTWRAGFWEGLSGAPFPALSAGSEPSGHWPPRPSESKSLGTRGRGDLGAPGVLDEGSLSLNGVRLSGPGGTATPCPQHLPLPASLSPPILPLSLPLGSD